MPETKILLSEKELPRAWYNIQADLPTPVPPPLNPATKQPIGPEDLAPVFPMGIIEQEVSTERLIEIPEEVLRIYKLWRPTPLYRALGLEKELQTPAKIYYKYEGVSPVGSHKPNTAVPQAYYNKKEGVRRLTTETGAGQWGCALSMACRFFELECTVFMVNVSYHQKPYRRSMMEVFGATVHASPSQETEVGRSILARDPNSPGSLGMAISEATEQALQREDTRYSLGSVLNHVLLHQTIIGLESRLQLEKLDDYPDIVIGCHGGGSNLGGIALPFVGDRLRGSAPNLRAVGAEPASCPSLTKGEYRYDFGDTCQLMPLAKMYTLGHSFVPDGIHAGGLRYHGASPIISLLRHEGLLEAVAYHQTAVFESAMVFARTEGIIPAPESAHAIKAAIDEAVRCREAGESKTILFCLSGNGYLDLAAYDEYLQGNLRDAEYSMDNVNKALAELPQV